MSNRTREKLASNCAKGKSTIATVEIDVRERQFSQL